MPDALADALFSSSQTLKKPVKAGSKHEGNRKTLKDEIVAVGRCT